eukprot:351566-Chlamydomonas_euryale.AAC.3
MQPQCHRARLLQSALQKAAAYGTDAGPGAQSHIGVIRLVSVEPLRRSRPLRSSPVPHPTSLSRNQTSDTQASLTK